MLREIVFNAVFVYVVVVVVVAVVRRVSRIPYLTHYLLIELRYLLES